MCALSLFRQTHAARDSVTAMLSHCLGVDLYMIALCLTLLTSYLCTLLNFFPYTLLNFCLYILLTSHILMLLTSYLYTLLNFCPYTLLTSYLYDVTYVLSLHFTSLLSLYFADFLRRIALCLFTSNATSALCVRVVQAVLTPI